MARSLWSGSITFGLVNVPVKMVTAVSPNDIHFHQLRATDGSRIQYKKVSSTDQKEVEHTQIVKGYEVAPNQFVKIKPEELETLDPKKSRNIEIERFVDLDEIDPLFYEHSYFLVPDENAGKAYTLLQEAMKSSNKVGLARMVMRSKEHVVALRGSGKAIALSTLYFKDELIPIKNLELPSESDKPQKKELDIALQLIEANSGKFEPDKYHDEYRDRVMDLIQRKSEGKEVVAQSLPKTKAPNVVNLMDALKASLASTKKRQEEQRPANAVAHRQAKVKAKKSA
jgi:DNA end-binding protein Ku